MKTIRVILAILGLPLVALAQTNTMTVTTLNGAVTNSQTSITLTSGTGVNLPSLPSGTQGSIIYVEREAMQVVGGTSPNFQVFRGWGGTRAVAHATSLAAIIGNPEWFSNAASGTVPSGTCTKAGLYVEPDIHVLDGSWYDCSDSGVFGFAGVGNGSPSLGNTLRKITATYTAKAWDFIISATSGTFTLTLPAASSLPGKVYYLVNPGSGTITVTTATNCATIATTTSCRVYSDGSAWQAF